MANILNAQFALDMAYNKAIQILPQEQFNDLCEAINDCTEHGALSVAIHDTPTKHLLQIETILAYHNYNWEVNNENPVDGLCTLVINLV